MCIAWNKHHIDTGRTTVLKTQLCVMFWLDFCDRNGFHTMCMCLLLLLCSAYFFFISFWYLSHHLSDISVEPWEHCGCRGAWAHAHVGLMLGHVYDFILWFNSEVDLSQMCSEELVPYLMGNRVCLQASLTKQTEKVLLWIPNTKYWIHLFVFVISSGYAQAKQLLSGSSSQHFVPGGGGRWRLSLWAALFLAH